MLCIIEQEPFYKNNPQSRFPVIEWGMHTVVATDDVRSPVNQLFEKFTQTILKPIARA